MYFKLSCKNQNYSYFLCKHPDNVYNNNIGKNREIIGKFVKDGNNNITEYLFYLNPNTFDFYKTAKQRNLAFYLNEEMYSVCPYNLTSFDMIFRSVLRGKNVSSELISDESFNEKIFQSAELGPFCCNYEYIEKVFGFYNLKVEKVLEEYSSVSYSINIKSEEKMSLTNFLQKIYILSLYCTFRKTSIFFVNEDTINKIIKLSDDWLKDHEYSDHIINKFCKYKKTLKNLFFENTNTVSAEDTILNKRDIIEEKLEKISLHEKRHNLLIDTIKNNDIKIKSIVDFCTSEGKLLKKLQENFKDIKILGIEKSFEKVKKFSNKNENLRVIESNILYPDISESDLFPDLLTCVEAIEHFKYDDRQHLLKLIKELFIPKYIYLTTPNVDFNSIYGLEEGLYRRKDHIIEYNLKQFKEEVESYLSDKYDIEYLNIIDSSECQDSIYIQPSICIFCTHKSLVKNNDLIEISKPFPNKDEMFTQVVSSTEWGPSKIEEWMNNLDFRKIQTKKEHVRKINYKFLRKIKEYHGNIFLPISGYKIDEKELNTGYTSDAFISNSYNIFYLGPNIAPVDYLTGDEFLSRLEKIYSDCDKIDDNFKNIIIKNMDNYLEHPLTSILYYLERGIFYSNSELNFQLKYMGSRGYILAFKDNETANSMGFKNKIIINSRGGFNFFDDPSILNDIHNEIFTKDNKYDYIMLDCEILPWNYKAESLINYSFKSAIESAIISKKNSSQIYDNEKNVLNTLNNFSIGEQIEIYPFHVLYMGYVGPKSKENYHGFYNTHVNSFEILREFGLYNGQYFKECLNKIFVLSYSPPNKQFERIVGSWLFYTGCSTQEELDYIKTLNLNIPEEEYGKYEGFVVKPSNFLSYTDAGYFHQPALKIRGKNYLNLIYGIDVYNDPNIFKYVSNRKITPKRILANQQLELSKYIIDATVHKNHEQRLKYTAAFLGMEHINSNIDKTL